MNPNPVLYTYLYGDKCERRDIMEVENEQRLMDEIRRGIKTLSERW